MPIFLSWGTNIAPLVSIAMIRMITLDTYEHLAFVDLVHNPCSLVCHTSFLLQPQLMQKKL